MSILNLLVLNYFVFLDPEALLWCLWWAFFELPDFIVDEEFALETVVFSVRFFATEETVEALPANVKVSANANTIKIVFIVTRF